MTKADHTVSGPAVDAAVKEHGSESLLFDLSDFHWEKANVWASDINFGRRYKDKVDRMVMLSEGKRVKHLAKKIRAFVSDTDARD